MSSSTIQYLRAFVSAHTYAAGTVKRQASELHGLKIRFCEPSQRRAVLSSEWGISGTTENSLRLLRHSESGRPFRSWRIWVAMATQILQDSARLKSLQGRSGRHRVKDGLPGGGRLIPLDPSRGRLLATYGRIVPTLCRQRRRRQCHMRKPADPAHELAVVVDVGPSDLGVHDRASAGHTPCGRCAGRGHRTQNAQTAASPTTAATTLPSRKAAVRALLGWGSAGSAMALSTKPAAMYS